MHAPRDRARSSGPRTGQLSRSFSFHSNSLRLCHLSGILCTILFSSQPICICIANIHFHSGFMRLPSLLIGFGSFPNVQSVPRNNYIPEESRMSPVADFDGFPAPIHFQKNEANTEAGHHVGVTASGLTSLWRSSGIIRSSRVWTPWTDHFSSFVTNSHIFLRICFCKFLVDLT